MREGSGSSRTDSWSSKWKALLLLFVALVIVVFLFFRGPSIFERVFRSQSAAPEDIPARPGAGGTSPSSPLPAQASYIPTNKISPEAKRQAQGISLAMGGRVANRGGAGLPKAAVSLWVHDPMTFESTSIAQTVADDRGFYSLEIKPTTGVVTLRATKEGYCEGRLAIDLAGESGLIEKNMVLMEVAASLSGTVRESGGRPIPRAKVAFRIENEKEGITGAGEVTHSSETGDFVLSNLPAGPGHLYVWAVGYPRKEELIEIDAGQNQRDIELEARPTYCLRVKNRRGEPVKYPRVYAVEGQRTSSLAGGDESGVICVLLTPSVRIFNWEVKAYGYLPKALKASPDGGRTEVTLDDGPLVSGVVVSAARRPLENALVVTGCRGPGAIGWTDSSGRFSFRTGCAEDLFLDVSCPGYISKSLRLSAQAPKENMVIRLKDPEGGVTGWVLHTDGRPVTRFMLQIEKEDPDDPFFSNRGIADPAGHFSVLDLPAGNLEMQITPADDRRSVIVPKFFRLEIRKGMVYSNVVVRLRDQPSEVRPEDP